jgi:hypothetical protein
MFSTSVVIDANGKLVKMFVCKLVLEGLHDFFDVFTIASHIKSNA